MAPEPYPHFFRLIALFHGSLDGIREAARLIHPALEPLDPIATPLGYLERVLPDDVVGILRRALERQENAGLSSDSVTNDTVSFTDLESELGMVVGASPDLGWRIPHHVRRVMARAGVPTHGELVRRALLTSAVAALESAVASIAEQQYGLHPGTLPASDKEFSLDDIREAGSVEAAESLAVSRRVDELLRKGFDEWTIWFRRQGLPTLGECSGDGPALVEILQRRHALTHHGATASRQYVQKTGLGRIGDHLAVSSDYLEDALDLLDVAGTVAASRAWAKWRPEFEGSVGVELAARARKFISGERWAAAVKIGEVAQSFSGNDRDRAARWCHTLLARKRSTGLTAEDTAALTKWNTEGLDPATQMARHSLLGDLGAALALFPQVADQLGLHTAVRTPFLWDLRDHEGFAALLAVIANSSSPEPVG
jgi:hypothetical protein